MDAQIKAKWIEALRGGKYVQAKQALKQNGKFCCLGVLCDISGQGHWRDAEDGCSEFHADDEVADGLLPECLREKVGLEYEVTEKLAEMNDDGFTFAEIADHIEQKL